MTWARYTMFNCWAVCPSLMTPPPFFHLGINNFPAIFDPPPHLEIGENNFGWPPSWIGSDNKRFFDFFSSSFLLLFSPQLRHTAMTELFVWKSLSPRHIDKNSRIKFIRSEIKKFMNRGFSAIVLGLLPLKDPWNSLFWEGHKNMRKSPSLIDVYPNKLGDFVKFLGLLGTYKISDFRNIFWYLDIQTEKYQMRSNLVPEKHRLRV